jgi:hypothetical protein
LRSSCLCLPSARITGICHDAQFWTGFLKEELLTPVINWFGGLVKVLHPRPSGKKKITGHRWLTAVILATQEAEIWRIMV